MSHQAFPGGWYVHGLWSGEQAVLYPGQRLETHIGTVPLPLNDEPLYHVITNVGGFQIAGQGHSDTLRKTYHWIDGVWNDALPRACGVSPVIFDRLGRPRVSDCSQGSQGFRQVLPGPDGGIIVTGDQSLARVVGSTIIHEFNVVADLLVGQGHDGGCVVWDGETVRLLHPGNCYEIRTDDNGVDVCVSFYDVAPDGLTAHIYRLPIAELRALLPVKFPPVFDGPSDAPNPVHVPRPKPEPLPMPTIPDSEIARAKAEIAAHPLGDNLPDLPWTRARVQALGGRWGLNGKRGNPNDPSHDIFAYRWSDDPAQQPLLVDVLGDGGGANVEAFQIQPWPEPAGAVWIDPGGATVPVPDPAQPPAVRGPGAQLDAELASLLTRLSALETEVAVLKARPVVAPAAPISLAGARVALKTADGHFLCAEGGGGGEVNASRESVGGWEVFTVEPQ